MRELSTRAVTGVIYVAVTLLAAWFGPFTTTLIFLPVCMLGARELHRLALPGQNGAVQAWYMLVAGAMHVAVAAVAFPGPWHPGFTIAVAFLLLLLSIAWLLLRGPRNPFTELGALVLTMVLVGLPFGLLAHFFTHGPWMLIGFMVLLWTNDTGAYLVGRSIGRTPLLPAVSPKKTVEGLLGGIVLTLLVAWLLSRAIPEPGLRDWLGCGVIIAITSTIGDLLESALKRARGVKDSGTLLPGHGGILDRFDGFLLAAPATLIYLHLLS